MHYRLILSTTLSIVALACFIEPRANSSPPETNPTFQFDWQPDFKNQMLTLSIKNNADKPFLIQPSIDIDADFLSSGNISTLGSDYVSRFPSFKDSICHFFILIVRDDNTSSKIIVHGGNTRLPAPMSLNPGQKTKIHTMISDDYNEEIKLANTVLFIATYKEKIISSVSFVKADGLWGRK